VAQLGFTVIFIDIGGGSIGTMAKLLQLIESYAAVGTVGVRLYVMSPL
jgi:hypothetical protein